jgi:hypothetical protein
MAYIAISSAELAYGTKLPAGQTKRVIRKDDLGCTIPVLILNIVDEGFDIDSSRASLSARCIVAF